MAKDRAAKACLTDHLLDALLLPEPEGRQAWDEWRAAIDAGNIPYASQQLFPALSPAFPEWLEGDPAAGIFKGIVRRVWSQNQLRLRKAVEVDTLLTQAGVRAVAAGPLAWSLRTLAPAIRDIPYLTFLVSRVDLRKAAEALRHAGWEPYADLPFEHAWDWYDHVCFRQESLQLNLHWRLLASPPEDAFECEEAFLSRVERIPWNGHMLSTTSREATLLHILCSQRDGDLPWQADVAQAGAAGIHWPTFLKLARRFAPAAIDRLREVQCFSSLGIPRLPPRPGPLGRRIRHAWKVYRANSYYQKKDLSWLGFVEFVAVWFAKKSMGAVPFRFPPK